VTSDVRIVGDPAKFAPFAPVVEDVFPGCGPLAGIHAALRKSETDLNLILAIDIPFVSPALLVFLVTQARNSPTSSVTVPRTAHGWQPLCAVYRRDFADAAERSLREGRYKIDALYDLGRTKVITEEDLQAAGFSSDTFRNLNTPEELADAAQ
jgi:molybdopterin-guanine dinucleotide biosynthesis protein A